MTETTITIKCPSCLEVKEDVEFASLNDELLLHNKLSATPRKHDQISCNKCTNKYRSLPKDAIIKQETFAEKRIKEEFAEDAIKTEYKFVDVGQPSSTEDHINTRPIKSNQDRSSTNKHIDGEWPFICDECDYKTHRRCNFKRHKETHTKDAAFKCNLCNYRSNQLKSLEAHMANHSNKSPFNCDKCNYKTHRKCNFTRHKETHVNVKTFKCKLCNYRSTRITNLETHTRKHSD